MTIEKLVGVYRVFIPHFIAAYTFHRNNTSEITDAPTIRSLNFILQDEFDDWRDGEMLIQSLIETPEEVDRAAAHQARLREADVGGRRHRRARIRSVRAHMMRKFFPVEELARDERFHTDHHARADGRPAHRVVQANASRAAADNRLDAGAQRRQRRCTRADARHLRRRDPGARGRRAHVPRLRDQHRRQWPDATDTVPFALKLDMARQAWDEARHVEISVKLSDWMGTEIGQFAENTVLFEAACSTDPVLRLAGVNRALEGLAIDVFTTMKEFGDLAGDPYLEFCEDWMLADEVTHVKMGSDWLRKVTEHDPERRKKALEFQSVVDKLFSFGGTRSDSEESPIGLARRFRELAGFTDDRGRRDRRGQPGGAQRAQGVRRPRRACAIMTVTSRRRSSSSSPSTRRRSSESRASSWPRSASIDHVVQVEVDETTPLGRGPASTIGDTITIHAESGAFEDTKRPRQLSESGHGHVARPRAAAGHGSAVGRLRGRPAR